MSKISEFYLPVFCFFFLEMFVKYRILISTRAVDVRLGYFTVLK